MTKFHETSKQLRKYRKNFCSPFWNFHQRKWLVIFFRDSLEYCPVQKGVLARFSVPNWRYEFLKKREPKISWPKFWKTWKEKLYRPVILGVHSTTLVLQPNQKSDFLVKWSRWYRGSKLRFLTAYISVPNWATGILKTYSESLTSHLSNHV